LRPETAATDLDTLRRLLEFTLVRIEAAAAEKKTPEPLPPIARHKDSRPRGPRPDIEHHRQVAEIVSTFGDDWELDTNLLAMCKEFDKRKVPFPPNWRKRRPPARSWARAASDLRPLVVEAVRYRLRMATKYGLETL
jgi:hypothetical protein